MRPTRPTKDFEKRIIWWFVKKALKRTSIINNTATRVGIRLMRKVTVRKASSQNLMGIEA
jgi:hypothetical protein